MTNDVTIGDNNARKAGNIKLDKASEDNDSIRVRGAREWEREKERGYAKLYFGCVKDPEAPHQGAIIAV